MNRKKKVVWGTGLVASKYAGYHGCEDIDFFIDNNRAKMNTKIFGRQVLHPSQISNWRELFILIPYNYYDEISLQLNELGLREGKDYIQYGIENLKSGEQDEMKQLEQALTEIESNAEIYRNKTLVFGLMAAHDKGICRFLNHWNELSEKTRMVLFSEASWMTYGDTASKIKFPFFILPGVFDEKRFPTRECGGKLTDEYETLLRERDELCRIAHSLRKQCIKMQKYYEYYFVYSIYGFLKRVVELTEPVRVVMWCSYGPLHTILRLICDEKGIPTGFIHPGILPGTFSLDVGGEMGESYPALCGASFHGLHVEKEELSASGRVWKYLKESSLNRKIQPQNHASEWIGKRLLPGRPVILYAGQNDYNSGLQYYDENARKYHSPVFQSSLEALLFLAELAERKEWNLIYKPHPVMEFYCEEEAELPSNVIYVNRADINEMVDLADVTVTILSQTAYVALIREKPAVMLGYTQLRRKGCTYEAFTRDSIERQIHKALEERFTDRQKKEFLLHIAQVNKYYLFDDLQEREIRYGRQLPVEWDEIEAFAKKLADQESRRE